MKNSLFEYTARRTSILCLMVFSITIPLAAGAATFGDATIFKSRNDLDQVALPLVIPANDHLFIGGDGIDNGNFVLTTDLVNGIQLGLRGNERFLSNSLPNNGVSTYTATPGFTPPDSGLATWNFNFHVDLGANLAPLVPSGDVKAPGPLTPTGIVTSVLMDVDFDPGVGLTNFVTFDLMVSAVNAGATNPLLIQDSQNMGFSFWQDFFGAPPFDPTALGEYTYRLRALDTNGMEIASVSMLIVVSPTVAVEETTWNEVKQLYR